jgi:hypothetical protein
VRTYKFREMDKLHQQEIVWNLGERLAKETAWKFVRKYPVQEAVALTDDVGVLLSDRRVMDVVSGLQAGGKFRPVLIDEIDEKGSWMEGMHRSIAAEELGMDFLPAFVRVE